MEVRILNWDKSRFRFGICNVQENYDFYFKWLLSKVKQVFIIKNLPETCNVDFLKEHLLLDGEIGFTKFNDDLYCLNGSRGGEPDEYYRPTRFIIANPRLGSKDCKIGEDCEIVYNTGVDENSYFGGGIYQLIKQTATLLADNIVSINCAQINQRVNTIFVADTPALQTSGELVLKRLYSGEPYNILTQDMLSNISVNPLSQTNSNYITELIELHNYILANFFQSLGIKSNDVMKKERLITGEIDSQNDFLAISVLDILTSWKEGFDRVNEMFGTNIEVELNPCLAHILTDTLAPAAESEVEQEETVEVEQEEVQETEEQPEIEETVEQEEPEQVETEIQEEETIENTIEEAVEQAVEIIETSMDTEERGETDD